MTKAKTKTTEPVSTLPTEGVYELQVARVLFEPDKLQFKNKSTDPDKYKDEYVVIFNLLGTEQVEGEYAGDPYQCRVFGIRETQYLVSTTVDKDTRERTITKTNAYKYLKALGLSVSESGRTRFKNVDIESTEGMFGRGFVRHHTTKDGKKVLKMKMDDLLPLDNQEHIEHNQSLESTVLL